MGICQTKNIKIQPIVTYSIANIKPTINLNWGIRAQIFALLLLRNSYIDPQFHMSYMSDNDFNSFDDNNLNLLSYAILGNKIDIASRLIDKISYDIINLRHKDFGTTSLWYACNLNHEFLAIRILDKTSIDNLKTPNNKYHMSTYLNESISPLYQAKNNNMYRVIFAIERRLNGGVVFDLI